MSNKRYDATHIVYDKMYNNIDYSVYSKRYEHLKSSMSTDNSKNDIISKIKNTKEINSMQELYDLIESTIKSSGYNAKISGFDIYNELSNFVEGKDNGSYIFLSKPNDNIVFEYNLEVLDEEFNLSTLRITDNSRIYNINFDD